MPSGSGAPGLIQSTECRVPPVPRTRGPGIPENSTSRLVKRARPGDRGTGPKQPTQCRVPPVPRTRGPGIAENSTSRLVSGHDRGAGPIESTECRVPPVPRTRGPGIAENSTSRLVSGHDFTGCGKSRRCYIALKGHGFIRAINAIKSSWPLGPEGRFSPFSLSIPSFSATCLLVPQKPQINVGLQPLLISRYGKRTFPQPVQPLFCQPDDNRRSHDRQTATVPTPHDHARKANRRFSGGSVRLQPHEQEPSIRSGFSPGPSLKMPDQPTRRHH